VAVVEAELQVVEARVVLELELRFLLQQTPSTRLRSVAAEAAQQRKAQKALLVATPYLAPLRQPAAAVVVAQLGLPAQMQPAYMAALAAETRTKEAALAGLEIPLIQALHRATMVVRD
jgi:hypothetical protein